MDITKYTLPTINKIVDAETLLNATFVLSQLNKKLDEVIADKELLTKPINETLKGIRAKYKPVETLLSEAITNIKNQMIDYATMQKAIQIKQEAQITARVERGTMKPETAINKLNTVQSNTSTTANSEHGKVIFKTVNLYRVKDIQKIPREYLQINDDAIKDAQSNNKIIDGIEYYTEERPINYRAGR